VTGEEKRITAEAQRRGEKKKKKEEALEGDYGIKGLHG
jgi:hypothetical protein